MMMGNGSDDENDDEAVDENHDEVMMNMTRRSMMSMMMSLMAITTMDSMTKWDADERMRVKSIMIEQ